MLTLYVMIAWLHFQSGLFVEISQTDRGLLAHYTFNRDPLANPAIIWDVSGNGNHGSVIGKVSYVEDRFGVECGALHFDGSTYCEVPNSSSLQSPEYSLTIAAWFKIEKGADFFREWITLVCKSNESDETNNSPQYRMQATAQTISLNTELTEVFVPPLDYDTWYFYAVVYDGISFRVFLNGRFVYEVLYTGRLHPNNMPLEIGRDLPGRTEFFRGTLDDLKIYKRALRASELKVLYAETNPDANRISWCQKQVPVVSSAPVAVPVQQAPASPAPPLKDTVAAAIPPVDSTDEDVIYRNLPKSIEGNPVKYQSAVEVSGAELTIYLFDNEKEDGDTISLNINGVWVRENYRLRLKSQSPEPAAMIRCTLFKGADNFLISKAINLGSIPPNTLTIAIDDGRKVQEVTINADVGLHGGILLKVK